MAGIMMPYMGTMGQQGYVNPNQIPNLSLWYNGSASTTTVNNVVTNNFNTTVVNGTSITSWIDLQNVGGPANVNGGAGRQPTYAIPAQNNLGSVLYNAASQTNLDINPTAWAQNLPGFTIYTVARPTSLPGTVFPLVSTGATNLGMWWNGTNYTVGQSAGNYGTVTVPNDTTKFHMYGLVFDGSQTGNSNRLKFRYDKTLESLSYTGTVSTTTGSINYFFFGGNNRNVGLTQGTYMSGYIGEVLIWTRTLSQNEIGQVEYYLTQKWGL